MNKGLNTKTLERGENRCPHLQDKGTSICRANPRGLTCPNEYELSYHCQTWRYEGCPIYQKYHHE